MEASNLLRHTRTSSSSLQSFPLKEKHGRFTCLCGMTPCIFPQMHRSFCRTCCPIFILHNYLNCKCKDSNSSEMLLNFCWTKRRRFTDDINLSIHGDENLKTWFTGMLCVRHMFLSIRIILLHARICQIPFYVTFQHSSRPSKWSFSKTHSWVNIKRSKQRLPLFEPNHTNKTTLQKSANIYHSIWRNIIDNVNLLRIINYDTLKNTQRAKPWFPPSK
jgi:hypothetical protein